MPNHQRCARVKRLLTLCRLSALGTFDMDAYWCDESSGESLLPAYRSLRVFAGRPFPAVRSGRNATPSYRDVSPATRPTEYRHRKTMGEVPEEIFQPTVPRVLRLFFAATVFLSFRRT